MQDSSLMVRLPVYQSRKESHFLIFLMLEGNTWGKQGKKWWERQPAAQTKAGAIWKRRNVNEILNPECDHFWINAESSHHLLKWRGGNFDQKFMILKNVDHYISFKVVASFVLAPDFRFLEILFSRIIVGIFWFLFLFFIYNM